MQDIIVSFIAAMREKIAIEPARAADIKADGQDHYFDIAGDKKSKRGGYCLTIAPDGFAFGNFRDFRNGESGSWHSAEGKKLDDATRKEFALRLKNAEREKAARQKKLWNEAAQMAVEYIGESLPATGEHPYLKRKCVSAVSGLMVDFDGRLVMPLSQGGKVWTYQTIAADGFKCNQENGRKQGSYFILDGRGDAVLVAEGYATAASVHEATGFRTYCTLDAGNMRACADEIRRNEGAEVIYFCADNDTETRNAKGEPFNVGLHYAEQAAVKVGGFVLLPPIEKADWNDYANAVGFDKFRNEILRLIADSSRKGVEDSSRVQDAQSLPAAPLSDDNWQDRLIWKNERSGILDGKSLSNVILLLTYHEKMSGCVVYDEFLKEPVVIKQPPWETHEQPLPRRLGHGDYVRLAAYLEHHNLSIGVNGVRDALIVASENNRINSGRDYLETLVWDGVPRLDRWLSYYMGSEAQDAEYLSKVGSSWLIAGAKRIYEPGAPFHHMLVLEGGQGAYKSTALKVLATFGGQEYFSDTFTFDMIEDKNSCAYLLGRVIVEIPELSGLSKKDANKVKQWITQTHDEVQRKYENAVTRYPRMYILAGTTNDNVWAIDATGNRRFWPVKVGEVIDIEALRKDSEQLWAEAVVRYKSGERYWIEKSEPLYEVMVREQANVYVTDVWNEIIERHVSGMKVVSVDNLLIDVLGVPRERWDNAKKGRIGAVLRHLGYENKSSWDAGIKKTIRTWVRK